MKTILSYTLSVLVISLFFLSAESAKASPEVRGYVPLAPIPGTVFDAQNKSCDSIVLRGAPLPEGCTTNLSRYLKGLYTTGVALAGFFAVFSLVRGGWTLLFSDSIMGHLEGKRILLQTVGGLIIVFSSYLLMNQINPQLARDLDIKLDFPRPQFLSADDSLLEAYMLTGKQLQMYQAAALKRHSDMTTRIADLNAQAAAIEQKASGMTDEEEKIITLLRARDLRRQAEELTLARDADGQERSTTVTAINARTQAEALAALSEATKAGGGLVKIQQAYGAARTAFASDPSRLAALSVEEMQDVSVANKALAFGLITHPPTTTSYVGSGGGAGGGAASQVITTDQEALQTQVASRIQAIIAERDAQIGRLRALRADADLPASQINEQVATLRGISDQQVCQIKNLCRVEGYSCKDLSPQTVCTY